MIKNGYEPPFPARASQTRFTSTMKWLSALIILALLTVARAVRAEEPAEQYLRIYSIMEQADSMNATNEAASAKAKYQQAQTELLGLKRTYPTWNPKLVSYRLSYLADKITALSQPAAASTGEVTRATQPQVKAATSPAARPLGPQVKLLEAGAEPRQALRLHPQAGDTQSLSMTMKIAMNMQLGDAPGQAMEMPAITMPMTVAVKSVSSNADIAYETVMGDATVAGDSGTLTPMAQAMKSSLGGIKGLSTTGTMSDRGLSKGTEVKLPAGADPEMSQTMDQMKESLSSIAAPFPEEAVGAGARWEVRQQLRSQGMIINQTVTYQLVSIEGNRLTAKIAMVQQAANQKIQNPAMPGVKVDVIKMTGTGSGEISLDLARLLPTHAAVATHSEVSMAMDAGGRKQTMLMKLDMNLSVESK